MSVKVWIGSEPVTPKDAAVYREEAVDDSGQPSMVGQWQPFKAGAHCVISRGTRLVIEQYDKQRHGFVQFPQEK